MGKKIRKGAETPSKDVFEPLLIESKKTATVVLMLSSPEEEILAKACESILKYAEKGDLNKSTLVELGALEPLSRLITHEDKLVRKNAFTTLGVMASNNDVKRALKKLDIIPSIISKLSPDEDVVVHEFATLCLVYLSDEFTNKVRITDSGGLEPLIHLLSSPDPDVTKNSVECICNLVQDLSSRVAVCKLNGISPLLELLHSDFPVIQQLALRTLESITTDPNGRSSLRAQQAFDQLLHILAPNDLSDLHLGAMKVICNCLEDTDGMALVQEKWGVATFLQFVATSTLQEVQAEAIQAICRMAHNGENRRILHEHNVERTLVNLLNIEHDGLRIAACQAVVAMSENLACKDMFRLLDGIRGIIQLLTNENGALRETAVHALSKLTYGNLPNIQAVYEADGIGLLVPLLQDERAATVAHTAAVLSNMATQEAPCHGILAHGTMATLLGPLQAMDSRVLSGAALLVAALACDADSRVQFRNAGGPSPLVKLLASNDAEVHRSACWAIRVCASDELTATEMWKLGALEVLQEINMSRNRRNKFSEAAFEQLLDSNLPVKYSLTGYLTSANVTSDGFYDPGQARVGHKVLSLEDLAIQGLNQHHAIIVVNGKPQNTKPVELPDDKQQDGSTPSHCSSLLAKGGRKTPSKGKSRTRKENENEMKSQQESIEEAPAEKPWTPPFDAAFCKLVAEASRSILTLHDEKEQYVALAKLVSDTMGGPVDRDKLHNFPWELHLCELKFKMQSNVIPIGSIMKGTFRHRALLFKALADRIGLNCSLVRWECSRAWNEIWLREVYTKVPGCYSQSQAYIVDLIHCPGLLLKVNSPGAVQYQNI